MSDNNPTLSQIEAVLRASAEAALASIKQILRDAAQAHLDATAPADAPPPTA